MGPKSSKITLTIGKKRGKERARRKKGGEEKKEMNALFSLYNGYFLPTKTVGRERPISR